MTTRTGSIPTQPCVDCGRQIPIPWLRCGVCKIGKKEAGPMDCNHSSAGPRVRRDGAAGWSCAKCGTPLKQPEPNDPGCKCGPCEIPGHQGKEPGVRETSLEDMLAEAAKRGGELGYQRGFQDALERAAKKLDDRIASLQKCEGNTHLQICECSVMARAIRALSENGDT